MKVIVFLGVVLAGLAEFYLRGVRRGWFDRPPAPKTKSPDQRETEGWL